jgi:hypothetical protein
MMKNPLTRVTDIARREFSDIRSAADLARLPPERLARWRMLGTDKTNLTVAAQQRMSAKVRTA